MPDLASISTAFQSLKLATDMVKDIRQSTTSLKDAAINFKVAELTNALADLQIALADVKVENLELKQKLAEISETENVRNLLKLNDNAYWPKTEEIVGFGSGPWCSSCFDKEEKLITLHHKVALMVNDFVSYKWECPSCNSAVSASEK
ncbi:hypothetical protein N474_22260 [Pseudoalteromonas luteoviolacea CPMOR-2]|uniref:hypothetical protein n=1 Tax=Pseudoalteromonas luteoviolacea TaxID=43657 RepID=UPI0007B0512F|nr:hypothetical protein [Pseudoalteromonas luteoviolacea]KZN53051.1 hypothetical protein N474_22260 [Pseudoalteromonas luteoviolacea CPMOR-2]